LTKYVCIYSRGREKKVLKNTVSQNYGNDMSVENSWYATENDMSERRAKQGKMQRQESTISTKTAVTWEWKSIKILNVT